MDFLRNSLGVGSIFKSADTRNPVIDLDRSGTIIELDLENGIAETDAHPKYLVLWDSTDFWRSPCGE